MTFDRLLWRVGLPFVLLVAVMTGALTILLRQWKVAEDRARLERVAFGTVTFIGNNSLPPSHRLAQHLSAIGDDDVYFRTGALIEPEPTSEQWELSIGTIPADGVAVNRQGVLVVALQIPQDDRVLPIPKDGRVVPQPRPSDLVLVQRRPTPWFSSGVNAILITFLLLAMLTAWLVVRGLVRPLRHLARQLPDIEKPGPIELPSASRNDEIGDLARAFLRTREALHEERRARERVEKLAVLGRMTAALAHEVQNPVAAIRMHAQLWRRGHDDGAADTIEHEAMRIENLLNQWMFLTRPEPPAKADVDLGALLVRSVAMHDRQAEHAAVTIRVDVPPGSIVHADSRRLDQVFRNLLTNALQAMPSGGILTIRARRDANLLRIAFADSGTGFSPTALQRFAEFFFSEKEGGMGIGLTVANEIAKAHGGRLFAENGPSGGAIVTVELPIAAAAVAAGTEPNLA